jgi:glycosyltransferase involved in cell wall biosynthesis
MSDPQISVVVPMRNAEPFVAEALRSILSQESPPFEIVVIDDGSTDRSAEVARGLGDGRIRVLPGPQRGIAAALNAGFAAARGSVVMRCDADDRYLPGRLAHQWVLLANLPNFGAVAGSYRSIDPAGRHTADLATAVPEGEITGRLRLGETPTSFCTFAVRAEVLTKIGGLREEFETAEDIDLQLRLAEITRIWFDPRQVYDYRLHAASITHSQADARRLFFERLARDSQRARQDSGADSIMQGRMPEPPPRDGAIAKDASAHLRGHLIAQAWALHRAGRWGEALRTGLRAAMATPGHADTWKTIAALLLKRPG